MPSRKEEVRTRYTTKTISFNGSVSTADNSYVSFKEDSHWRNSPRDSKGKIAYRPNPCNMSKVHQTYGDTFYSRKHYRYSDRITYTFSQAGVEKPPSPVTVEVWSRLHDQALRRLYDELYDIDANFLQILAERRQTFNLITQNIKRLTNLYSSLRRGYNPFKGYSKVRSKDAANIWLEYTYGWVPLVLDVYSLVDLHNIAPPPSYFSIHRKDEINESITKPGSGLYGEERGTLKAKPRVTLSGFVSLSNPGLNFLGQLGITNPALLAWELLPYSFVVDWFLPVGDWLKWHAGLHAVVLTDTAVTRSLVETYDATVNGSSGYYYGEWNTASYSASHLIQGRHREVKSLPAPGLSLQFPDNWKNGVSALALMRQRFS